MRTLNFVLTVCLVLFLCQTAERCFAQSNAAKPADIIGKHIIQFTKPAAKIPVHTSAYAPLLGNGFTGIAIAGTPDKQTFYAARNDFWRLQHGYCESYPLCLGKIELNIPQLKDASFLLEQHLYDAVTTARFAKDSFTVTYKIYTAATEDVFVAEVSMQGDGSLNGNVQLVLPGALEIIDRKPTAPSYPDVKERQTISGGIQYISRAYETGTAIPTKAAIALYSADIQGQNGQFVLTSGKPLRFVCAFSSNFKSRDCVAAAVDKVREFCNEKKIEETETAHKNWWHDYWAKSFVSIPNKAIEKQYYVSLYGSASTSRDKDFPPGIFGTWVTKEQPAWAGDYHLNYNYQAPFYALYSANRIEQAEPFYPPLAAFMERGKFYSEKVTGVPDGLLYPVGIGPCGIETTRRNSILEKHKKNYDTPRTVQEGGMFWGQKSNAAYCAVNLSMHFYHTWDKDYCRRVYPFVKGVAVFWEKYLKYEEGRYVIYNDSIHEGSGNDKNPILSLGLVKLVMQTAADMSGLLEEDADHRKKWLHIRDNLSEFPLQERSGKTVFRYTETGLAWNNGNTLGIQHIYPAGQIGLNSDAKLLETARNTIAEMGRWLDGNGSNSFFPAAVRVGFDADEILRQLERYSLRTYPNGFPLDNPHGIENWSTVPNTVNEMLCMGHQDIVRLFPVWNKKADAAFHQIRVEGAFLVSAELKDGVVQNVRIVSERGRDLTLLNPWQGRRVSVKENGGAAQVYEGAVIKFSTKADGVYAVSGL
ncbi:MAG: hypothetical protein LBT89_02260 [Planctomycetaceae bacterium]|jgi:hypothetical protein|nr:hypothetical protein [Planctomycetaceae bacterium]